MTTIQLLLITGSAFIFIIYMRYYRSQLIDRAIENLTSKLIEEFMIAANVAAAHAIEKAKFAAIFRVHEPPAEEKIADLREWLEHIGYGLSKGDGLKAVHFNKVIRKAAETPESQIVSTAILRSQMQAFYSPKNLGHFGLALTHYCHFTSPIRRYSDLIVHRALISILSLGKEEKDGLSLEQAGKLPAIAEHISMTERRAMLAERDANDRYIVAYMADKLGAEFEGYIANLNSFGLFVALYDTGAQGFIPIGALGADFYIHDKPRNCLIGRHSGNRFDIGQKVLIKVREANPITGSLLFELLGAEGSTISHAPLPRKNRAGGKKGRHFGDRNSNKKGGKHKRR